MVEPLGPQANPNHSQKTEWNSHSKKLLDDVDNFFLLSLLRSAVRFEVDLKKKILGTKIGA